MYHSVSNEGMIGLEQLLEILPPDMRAWVRDKESTTCQEAGKLSDGKPDKAIGVCDHKVPRASNH